MYKKSQKKGFVTLLLVLVAGAISIAIATAVILAGLYSSRNSLTLTQSYQARALAGTCAEIALETIRENSFNYDQVYNTNLFNGNCGYYISGWLPGILWTWGNFGQSSSVLTINYGSAAPPINLTSWQETPP